MKKTTTKAKSKARTTATKKSKYLKHRYVKVKQNPKQPPKRGPELISRTKPDEQGKVTLTVYNFPYELYKTLSDFAVSRGLSGSCVISIAVAFYLHRRGV